MVEILALVLLHDEVLVDAESDIRPLIRDQLRLLRAEVEQALEDGVRDRLTRIHLEDVVVRIDAAL